MQTKYSTTALLTARRFLSNFVTIAILALGTTLASAHPGHSWQDESVSHFVTSPYHLVILTMIGLGLVLGAVFVQRLITRRAMQLTGVTALAVGAVLAAIHFFS